MILTSKTRLLLAGFSALVLLLLFGPDGASGPQSLPGIPSFSDKAVERVEIRVGAADKIALVRGEEDSWDLEQPLTGEADSLAIDSVLDVFRKGVSMDVLVDTGNEDSYGLAGADRIDVAFLGVQDVELASFAVGWDAPGGASFVSLPNDARVFRAKIGGRVRYQKTAADWRNKMVMQIDPESIRAIQFERPTGTLSFAFSAGVWTLLEDPDFDLDQKGFRNVAKSLSRIRASQLLASNFDGGFDAPSSRVSIELEGGETHVLVFGSLRARGAAFVRLAGADAVYRVSAMKRDATLGQKEDYKSLQIFETSPSELARVRLDSHDGVFRVLSRRDDQLWEVTEPPNVTGNLQDIAFGLNALSQLRADGIHSGFDAVTGLERPRFQFRVEYADGREEGIRVGNLFRDPNSSRALFFVQKEGESDLFVVRAASLTPILKAFNRSL